MKSKMIWFNIVAFSLFVMFEIGGCMHLFEAEINEEAKTDQSELTDDTEIASDNNLKEIR